MRPIKVTVYVFANHSATTTTQTHSLLFMYDTDIGGIAIRTATRTRRFYCSRGRGVQQWIKPAGQVQSVYITCKGSVVL